MARAFVGTAIVALFLCGTLWAGDAEEQYQEGIHKMDVEGKLEEAIVIFQKVAEASTEKNPSRAAKSLWQVAVCYEKQGKREEQMKVLQQIVDKFPKEEALVKAAREKIGKNPDIHPLVGTWKGKITFSGEEEVEIMTNGVAKGTIDGKVKLYEVEITINGVAKGTIDGKVKLYEKEWTIVGGALKENEISFVLHMERKEKPENVQAIFHGKFQGDLISGEVTDMESGKKQGEGTWSVIKDSRPHAESDKAGTPISIDVQDAPIQEVLRILARASGVSIIVSPHVKGSVSLSVSGQPMREVLEYVIKTCRFKAIWDKPDVVRIVTE